MPRLVLIEGEHQRGHREHLGEHPGLSNFNLLAVRTGEEAEDILYPNPGDQPDTVELEPGDGPSPITFTTTELNLRQLVPAGESKRLARIKDIKAQVTITEGRVAVACSKYEKGGGFTPLSLGALPVAAGLNAVGKARAARRRRGKMLVGHIRYPRLLSVGFRDRSGLAYPARLRISTLDPTSQGFRALLLDINLPKQQSGLDLVQTIAGLSANYNLAHAMDLSDGLRGHLESPKEPPPLSPLTKEFASYIFVDTQNSFAEVGLRVA